MSEYIYGRNATIEALRSNRSISTIYISSQSKNNKDIIDLASNKNITIEYKDKSFLDKIYNNNQGVIAKVFQYEYASLDKIINNDEEYPIIVILDGIEDPHNFGAILRTCEIVKASGVIIPKNRSVSVTPTVAKVACGGVENVNIAMVTNLTQTIKTLKENGYWIVGAEALDNAKSLWDMDFKMKTCLVIGSEGKGISRLVREECDFLVKIPMWGKINSLNASVSCAVILYEIRRQVTTK